MIRLWKGRPVAPSFSLKPSALRLCLLLSLSCLAAACHRRPAAPPAASSPSLSPVPGGHAAATPGLPEFAVDAVAAQEGTAVWYDVPAQSLPERRAWSGEMTAASDTLPLNAYVRVRRIGPGDNGRSVVVRITDSGPLHAHALIDLDRPAAEALGMVARGEVRVRAETLALKHADADKPVGKKDAAPMTAAQITSTPAATREQEKDAATAKAGGATP